MEDPYNYPFLQRDRTMYLSTITKQDFMVPRTYIRDSSFLKNDISGAQPKEFGSRKPAHSNFALSTYVEPKPQGFRKTNRISDPLKVDDIEGARPKVNQFRSRRVVNPLCPIYKLPTALQVSQDPGRKFMRDTLLTEDVNMKKHQNIRERGIETLKQPIKGSKPKIFNRSINALERLQVKDINKDGIFQSNRHTNPLIPNYYWRDQEKKTLNNKYGNIDGSCAKKLHPIEVNKPNLALNIADIEGTASNSAYARAYFMEKRRDFYDSMNIANIEKAQAATLKKGIITNRKVNPLMPKYQYPGHSEKKVQ